MAALSTPALTLFVISTTRASYGPKRRITMSAFICTDRHIATIATAYAALVPSINAQALADELKAINIESVNFRYAHHGNPEPVAPCDLDDAGA